MTEADKLLAQCILLQRLLKDKLDDFVDEVKKTKPQLASIIRNDVRTLTRNHEYFYKKIEPAFDKSNYNLFDDFEYLMKTIDKFFNETT